MLGDAFGGALLGLFVGGVIWSVLALVFRIALDWLARRNALQLLSEIDMDPKWFADIAAAAITFGVLGAVLAVF